MKRFWKMLTCVAFVALLCSQGMLALGEREMGEPAVSAAIKTSPVVVIFAPEPPPAISASPTAMATPQVTEAAQETLCPDETVVPDGTPTPTPAPTAQEAAAAEQPQRSVRIFVEGKGTISLGDTVILRAELTGFEDAAYTLEWQASGDDGKSWTCVGNGDTLSVKVTEANCKTQYRVVVDAE